MSNGDPAHSAQLSGPRLAQFLEKVGSFRHGLDRLVSRGYPEAAIKIALLSGIREKSALADGARLETVAAALSGAGFDAVAVLREEEHGTWAIRFGSRRDGVERIVRLDWNLVTSAEYRALANNVLGLEAAAATSFTVARSDKPEEVTAHGNLDDALEQLYGGAKKGVSVQRYKGLGEMNPTHLWETTMDPTRRRLLQVRIEDDVEADSIFTVLMEATQSIRAASSFRPTPSMSATWTFDGGANTNFLPTDDSPQLCLRAERGFDAMRTP